MDRPKPPPDDVVSDWEALVTEALPAAPSDPELKRLAAEAGLVHDDAAGFPDGGPAVPDADREVVEAGLADLVANVELGDLPVDAVAAALDNPGGPPLAPHEDPAIADALAWELSISDLLAEDLPIPESAVGGDELSLRELLAEDLAGPDTEIPPGRVADAPFADAAPLPMSSEVVAEQAKAVAAKATAAAEQAKAKAAADRAKQAKAEAAKADAAKAKAKAEADRAKAEEAKAKAEAEQVTADARAEAERAKAEAARVTAEAVARAEAERAKAEAARVTAEAAKAEAEAEADAADPGSPPEPTYRPLPEARPGIMRGLRTGWNRPRR